MHRGAARALDLVHCTAALRHRLAGDLPRAAGVTMDALLEWARQKPSGAGCLAAWDLERAEWTEARSTLAAAAIDLNALRDAGDDAAAQLERARTPTLLEEEMAPGLAQCLLELIAQCESAGLEIPEPVHDARLRAPAELGLREELLRHARPGDAQRAFGDKTWTLEPARRQDALLRAELEAAQARTRRLGIPVVTH